MGRRVLILAVIAGAVFFFFKSHRAETPKVAHAQGSGSGVASMGMGCINAAERASSALHDAGMLVMRPPVDQSAWGSAESSVSSALSSAESSCSGGNTESDRKVLEEVRQALSLMRTSLSDLSTAARGGGGATELATRQGEIDRHLDAARAAQK